MDKKWEAASYLQGLHSIPLRSILGEVQILGVFEAAQSLNNMADEASGNILTISV